MSFIVDSATAILSGSERRLEIISQNVANIATPGYKRQVGFAVLTTPDAAAATQPDAARRARDSDLRGAYAAAPGWRTRSDLAAGKLSATGNPLDLAIAGDGFFQLRDGNDLVYSRQGNFRLAGDGTLVTPQGFVLQQAGGGDLILERAAVTIAPDGTVLDNARPVARIAVFLPAAADGAQGNAAATAHAIDGALFRFDGGDAREVPGAQIRQGMVEASNVSVGEEMVTMMAALRQAESGARLVQVYDDLLGRAITGFGESGR